VNSPGHPIAGRENYAIDPIDILVGRFFDFQAIDNVLTTEVVQLDVCHVFEDEVHCGWFLRMVRIDTENRLPFASEKNTDDLCIMKAGPTSKPLCHRVTPSQL